MTEDYGGPNYLTMECIEGSPPVEKAESMPSRSPDSLEGWTAYLALFLNFAKDDGPSRLTAGPTIRYGLP